MAGGAGGWLKHHSLALTLSLSAVAGEVVRSFLLRTQETAGDCAGKVGIK